MDVVASRFHMFPNRGAKISLRSRLEFGLSRFPISFTIPNIREWARFAGHFVHNAFQLLFCRSVFGLLGNISQCFQWVKSCLDVSRLKIRRMRSDTPFT